MLTIAVVNLKGGTTKTTSTAYLAHALAEAGLATIAVDADPQASLQRWHADAEWSIHCIGMATPTLHRQLPGVIGTRFAAAVIDTPPLDEQRGIVMSALRIATHVVVPVAPTPIEYERLTVVRTAIADAGDVRQDGPPPYWVLLTRTVSGAASTEAWRMRMTDDGDQVLKATVGRLERFSQAYGDPITSASATAYGDAVVELLDAAP